MRHPQQPVRVTFDPRARGRFKIRVDGILVPGVIKRGRIKQARSIALAVGRRLAVTGVADRLLR